MTRKELARWHHSCHTPPPVPQHVHLHTNALCAIFRHQLWRPHVYSRACRYIAALARWAREPMTSLTAWSTNVRNTYLRDCRGHRPIWVSLACSKLSFPVIKLLNISPVGAIAITYRVFVNQENSALPNLALTLTLDLTLTLTLT